MTAKRIRRLKYGRPPYTGESSASSRRNPSERKPRTPALERSSAPPASGSASPVSWRSSAPGWEELKEETLETASRVMERIAQGLPHRWEGQGTLRLQGDSVGCHSTIKGSYPVAVDQSQRNGQILVYCFACDESFRPYQLLRERFFPKGLLLRESRSSISEGPDIPESAALRCLESPSSQNSKSVEMQLYYSPLSRVTLGKIKELKVWIPCQPGGAPAYCRFGVWRQSLPDREGGPYAARWGRHWQKGKRILPWIDWETVKEKIWRREQAGIPEGCEPALCFAGEERNPCPHDVMALDVDYSPEKDTTGEGKQLKRELLNQLSQKGWLCFQSRSGKGFHALSRYENDQRIFSGKRKRIKLGNSKALAVDLFLPGSRKMLRLRLEQPLTEKAKSWEEELPVTKEEELNSLLEIQPVLQGKL